MEALGLISWEVGHLDVQGLEQEKCLSHTRHWDSHTQTQVHTPLPLPQHTDTLKETYLGSRKIGDDHL